MANGAEGDELHTDSQGVNGSFVPPHINNDGGVCVFSDPILLAMKTTNRNKPAMIIRKSLEKQFITSRNKLSRQDHDSVTA